MTSKYNPDKQQTQKRTKSQSTDRCDENIVPSLYCDLSCCTQNTMQNAHYTLDKAANKGKFHT